MHASRSKFLNVDLDVLADRPLRGLARAMEDAGAYIVHCGRIKPNRYRASFETGTQHRSANATIQDLVRMVRNLPPRALRDWERATSRDFSIGIGAGSQPFSIECLIRPRTVAMVARLGASLSVTVYAPQGDADDGT